MPPGCFFCKSILLLIYYGYVLDFMWPVVNILFIYLYFSWWPFDCLSTLVTWLLYVYSYISLI